MDNSIDSLDIYDIGDWLENNQLSIQDAIELLEKVNSSVTSATCSDGWDHAVARFIYENFDKELIIALLENIIT